MFQKKKAYSCFENISKKIAEMFGGIRFFSYLCSVIERREPVTRSSCWQNSVIPSKTFKKMAKENIAFAVNLRQNQNSFSSAFSKYFAEPDSKEPLNLKGCSRFWQVF